MEELNDDEEKIIHQTDQHSAEYPDRDVDLHRITDFSFCR